MTSTPRSSRRTRLVGAALLVAVFLSGVLAGVAADRLLGRPAGGWAHAGGRWAERRGGPLADLADRLDLTPEQRARVEAVLERRHGEIKEFWRESGPRLRTIVDSTHVEIRSVLTASQREEFESVVAERRARHEARHGRGRTGLKPPRWGEDEKP